MNPFTAELAAEHIRDLQSGWHTSRVVRRRPVRRWIGRTQLGPTNNYVPR